MKKLLVLIFVLTGSFLTRAQDAELMNTHQPEKLWYLEPWIWTGSGILLLLIMLSLLLRISKKKKEPQQADPVAPKPPTPEGNSINDNSIHS